jgi:transposase-like protein
MFDAEDYRAFWREAEMECHRLRMELASLRRQAAAATSATDAEPKGCPWCGSGRINPAANRSDGAWHCRACQYSFGKQYGLPSADDGTSAVAKHASACYGVAVHDDFGAA